MKNLAGHAEPEPTMPLATLADRVWFAWQCLPRGLDGDPPSFRSLEEEHQLPEGVLSKLVRGVQKSANLQTADRVATALAATCEWLFYGKSSLRPQLTGAYRPRTRADLSGRAIAEIRAREVIAAANRARSEDEAVERIADIIAGWE